MEFERLCGMASAATLLLVGTLVVLQPNDWGSLIINGIGWIIAIAGVAAAWLKSQKQIALAETAIAINRAQIREAEKQSLIRQFYDLAEDIDRLKLARSYLETFLSHFPPGVQRSSSLVKARRAAHDFISHAAISAPFGFGPRVETVISRIQRLGERLEEADPGNAMPKKAYLDEFEPWVSGAIDGLQALAVEIGTDTPKREQRLIRLKDQLDAFD